MTSVASLKIALLLAIQLSETRNSFSRSRALRYFEFESLFAFFREKSIFFRTGLREFLFFCGLLRSLFIFPQQSYSFSSINKTKALSNILINFFYLIFIWIFDKCFASATDEIEKFLFSCNFFDIFRDDFCTSFDDFKARKCFQMIFDLISGGMVECEWNWNWNSRRWSQCFISTWTSSILRFCEQDFV